MSQQLQQLVGHGRDQCHAVRARTSSTCVSSSSALLAAKADHQLCPLALDRTVMRHKGGSGPKLSASATKVESAKQIEDRYQLLR